MLAYFDVSLGWRELLKRTARETSADNGLGLAAQLAYYFFLALFPALLFLVALAEVFAAEQQLVPALGRMAAKATNPDLKAAFERTAAGVPMIIEEGERLLKGVTDPDVLDAALIGTAQRIEHVEIANYGTLRTYAGTLGHTHAAELLQQTLEAERATDLTLTRIAERFVNPQSLRTDRPA
jgi:ferritin-like metal-binding protein YciE